MAAIDNLFSQGIQLGMLEFPNLIMEKALEYVSAPVIGFGAYFRLGIHLEEPLGNRDPFDPHGLQGISQQGTSGIHQLVGMETRMSPPGEVIPGQPLGHETGFPGADMLIGNQNIAGPGGIPELIEQQVSLINLSAGGKGPVAADPLTAHARAFHNTRVCISPGRCEPPEPGQSRRQYMQDSQNTIARLFCGTGRSPDPEGADIHGNLIVNDSGDNIPGDYDPGIRTGCIRIIIDMVPDQGGPSRHSIDIQKQKGAGRSNGKTFKIMVRSVLLDMVDTGQTSPPPRPLSQSLPFFS